MGVGTDDGSDGTLTLQQDGTWQGEGKNGDDTRVTLTLTEGTTKFANGDEFKFSTFKRSATVPKQNEIATGELSTVTAVPYYVEE